MDRTEGRIIRSSGGFYYVRTPDQTEWECRAKGRFRKERISPLVGDWVEIETGDAFKGTVSVIGERKNAFRRPPVANLDQLIIVVSAAEPSPNLLLIDRMTALAVHKDVTPVVVLTKSDLADCDSIRRIYDAAGIRCLTVCAAQGQGIDEVRPLFRDRISALMGNTGVGKSTLLNAIDPGLSLATGEISEKLGRGRHTTRTVELFEVEGGLVIDTPGFSSIDAKEGEWIRKEALADAFPEFAPYQGDCRFVSCAHIGEKGCAVCAAAARGEIPVQRLENYQALYREVKDYKDWQKKAYET